MSNTCFKILSYCALPSFDMSKDLGSSICPCPSFCRQNVMSWVQSKIQWWGVLFPGYWNHDICTGLKNWTKNSMVEPLNNSIVRKKKKQKKQNGHVCIFAQSYSPNIQTSINILKHTGLVYLILQSCMFIFCKIRLAKENKTEQKSVLIFHLYVQFVPDCTWKLLFNGQTKCHTGTDHAQPGNRMPLIPVHSILLLYLFTTSVSSTSRAWCNLFHWFVPV